MSVPLRLAPATTETPQLGDPSGHFWSKCSDHFLSDPNLNDSDKVVLQALVSLCRGGLSCQDSNKVIGERCHKEEKTINKVIKRLEDRGIITRIANGPWRTIHLNFGFRGQVGHLDYPRANEGVKGEITPAQVRTKPRATEGEDPQMRGGTPAQARTIIRLSPEQLDPNSDGRGVAVGGSQNAPPPPNPEARTETQEGPFLIPSPFPLPPACSLPDEVARFLPRDIPPGIIKPGSRSISRSPSGQMFPMPLTTGDLLNQDDALAAKMLLNSLDPSSGEHNIMRIVIRRHNAAFGEVLKGKVLPVGQNVREVGRIIDISPVFVRTEPVAAHKDGPATPVEKSALAHLGSPVGHTLV